MLIVYRYAFNGVNVTCTSKYKKDDMKIFDDDTKKIYVYKQETTLEASGAEWRLFENYFKDVFNSEIFNLEKAAPEIPELKGLFVEEGQVVALSDIKQVFIQYSQKWHDKTFKQLKSDLMLSISSKSFNLKYELPFDKRFVGKLQCVIESKGFVVGQNIPQDSFTIFGKSQPDAIIYKANGEFLKDTAIIGASICMQDQWWEVKGATLGLERAKVHLESRSKEMTQCCVNMLRVAGFLMEKALGKGKVVEEIIVFGLLISHGSPYCIPLKYHAHCISGEVSIMKGDEMLFEKGLSTVLINL